MPSRAYLKLKGSKQGLIKGSVTQKGPSGSILVLATHHEVSVPHDVTTGQPSGKRQHKVFSVTKEVDPSTPALYSALVNNETFSEWELEFWRTNASGAEAAYYVVKLTRAAVVTIEFVQPDARNAELANH